MNALELTGKLAGSPFVRSEISLQMQLGLPALKRMGGELCISFKPHKEELKDGKICYYPAQYEVAWAYPFEHIVLFRNLKYTDTVTAAKPIYETDAVWMLDIGRHYMQELYNACSEALTFREEYGKINDTVLRKYQAVWKKTVRQLGFGMLYGE